MPKLKRHKTTYPGVYYIEGTHFSNKTEDERIFYIRYRKDGKLIEDKVGRQFKDNMTAAKANNIRSLCITGKRASNKFVRDQLVKAKSAKSTRWTINRLWEEYKKNKTVYKGIQRDASRFNVHISPRFGEKEINDIATLDIDQFRKDLLTKKKLSPQTVKNTLELLRRICNFGFKKDLVPRKNISFEMPLVDNEIDESMTNGQIKSLMSVLDQNKHLIESWLMKVLLYTGRRTGEICALEWADIDFERQTMNVKDTKNGKSQSIPFSDQVKDILSEMPRFNDQYLFPNTDGSKRSRVSLNAKEMQQQAGIPKHFRSTYCLRHTFASLCASNDIPDRVLKALMGHNHREAKKDITSRYTHVTNERLLRAANSIGKIIDNFALS